MTTWLNAQRLLASAMLLSGLTASTSAFAATEQDGTGYSVGSLPSENRNASPIFIGQSPTFNTSSNLGSQASKANTNTSPSVFGQSNPNEGRTKASPDAGYGNNQRGGLNGTRSGMNTPGNTRGTSDSSLNNTSSPSGFGAANGSSMGGATGTGAGTMGSGNR